MAENSAIEWTHHTFNPWWGCEKVSPACDNCYAERDAKRFFPDAVIWGPKSPRRVFTVGFGKSEDPDPKHWNAPLGWNRKAEKAGVRHRVFCASMADVFDNHPAAEEQRPHLWSLIHKTPHLDWLLLTKRISNAARMVHEPWMRGHWPKNAWLGITVVNQEEADRDIPKLLALPARVRFLSIEPMLGPINLQQSCTTRCPNGDCFQHGSGRRVVVDSENGGTLIECICSRLNGLHWVIAGGESGPKARPAHPDWFRSLRDQCADADVPFLFKQWGEWWEVDSDGRDESGDHRLIEVPGPEAAESFDQKTDRLIAHDGRVFASLDDLPEETRCRHMTRLGKKAAGRLLDGIEHNGFPGR